MSRRSRLLVGYAAPPSSVAVELRVMLAPKNAPAGWVYAWCVAPSEGPARDMPIVGGGCRTLGEALTAGGQALEALSPRPILRTA